MAPPSAVLHLIDTGGPGGAETIFLKLVTRLDTQRWRSIAVVPERDWLSDALADHGVEPVLLPSRGSFDVGYLRGMAALIRRHNVRLIQTHLLTTAVYASVAAMPRRLPVVSTFHGQNDVAAAEPYRGAKYRIIGRRGHHHVFVSHTLRSWFLSNANLDAARAHVIHNGIDCTLFRPSGDRSARAELGVEPDDWLIGAVGNLRDPKDYPTFLRAAALLSQKSERYKFVIVGAGDARIQGELEALRRELGLGERLRFAGFRSDIERVLNALDVYALSSSSEGFSLTTTQAMACGVPVVATRSGGPEEIVTHNESGILVAARAPGELADAIEGLCRDEARRRAFGQAGRERVLREFSIDAMVSGYSALYETVASRRGSQQLPATA
jgi:glycosyltransferase involved in cell wall biosynthesis